MSNREYDGMPESNRGNLMVASRLVTNWVKGHLISTYARPGFDVLDLGFGRGGDLHKYIAAGVQNLTGVDISRVSLAHARKRLENRHPENTRVTLMEADMTEPLPDAVGRADVVFSMFSMHYAFRTRISAHQFFRSARAALGPSRPYKYLVCVTVDDRMLEPMESSIMSIGPISPPGPDGFGEGYTFWYTGCVDRVTEWVVRPNLMESAARAEGFQVVSSANLWDYYVENSHVQVPLTADEIRACQLYRVVVFSPVST